MEEFRKETEVGKEKPFPHKNGEIVKVKEENRKAVCHNQPQDS